MNKFWNWVRNSDESRTLYLNGTIAEESWFDDDITPAAFKAELLAGGYAGSTPAAVVYKATWPEEKIFRCTVDTLHKTVTENGLTKTSLIIVGDCMGDKYLRSLLYHPGFTTEFREATE